MPLFWSLAAVITLVCMGVLVWPLLRKSSASDAPDVETASIAIFRDQKRQLEHERLTGVLRDEDYAPAVPEAERRAGSLVSNNPDLLADYADVLAMTQGQRLAGKPMELIEKALSLDPKQHKALALAATAALERRDAAGALRYWRTLQAQFEP